MKHILMVAFALVSTACTAATNFEGTYKRQGASDFEINQKMNTSVSVEKQQDEQYLVTFHNGYGNVIKVGQVKDGQLFVNDMVINKQSGALKINYVDNPDVVFTFKAEK